jgi:hypothetical protein
MPVADGSLSDKGSDPAIPPIATARRLLDDRLIALSPQTARAYRLTTPPDVRLGHELKGLR